MKREVNFEKAGSCHFVETLSLLLDFLAGKLLGAELIVVNTYFQIFSKLRINFTFHGVNPKVINRFG